MTQSKNNSKPRPKQHKENQSNIVSRNISQIAQESKPNQCIIKGKSSGKMS